MLAVISMSFYYVSSWGMNNDQFKRNDKISQCNVIVAKVKQDPSLITKRIEYLQNTKNSILQYWKEQVENK